MFDPDPTPVQPDFPRPCATETVLPHQTDFAASLSFQRLVDLDIAPQYVRQQIRQTNSLLLGFTREVFPNAPLDRSGQKNPRVRRHVVEAANALAEVDLRGHLVVFAGSIIHTYS